MKDGPKAVSTASRSGVSDPVYEAGVCFEKRSYPHTGSACMYHTLSFRQRDLRQRGSRQGGSVGSLQRGIYALLFAIGLDPPDILDIPEWCLNPGTGVPRS